MVFNDLIDLVNKEKRKQERVVTVQQLALGAGMLVAAVLTIKILIARKAGKVRKMERDIKKAERARDSVSDSAQEVNNVMEDVQEKAEDVKKGIKKGSHEI